jgi:transposase InsO family protein
MRWWHTSTLPNHLTPTADETPAVRAASSLEHPAAIARQNGRRSARCSTGGRPGDLIFARPIRSARRFLAPIGTSCGKVLRRWVEFTQYCSADFQRQLAAYGMLSSMSRKGNCWDNAPSESFFNSLKNERVHESRYEARAEARADVFEYIEVFYNRSRRHSALGFISPVSFYDAWLQKQAEPKLAA